MSNGYITVVSNESGTSKCKLGETIIIKGTNIKTGLFDTWRYSIIIGSGIGETLLMTDQKGSNLKDGIIYCLGALIGGELEPKLYDHAYPYGEGRSCYIRVIGTKGDETVEYRAFINLYGELLPKFDLSVDVKNEIKKKNGNIEEIIILEDFGNNAVKGISKVTAKIEPETTEILGDVVSETAAAQFTGGVFSKTFQGNQEEYTVTLDPIETSGEVYVFANVASTLGYQSSQNTKFNVLNYQKPRMSFDIAPTRFDENTGVDIKKVTPENKNGRFSIRFKGKISPCGMKNENGVQICKIKSIDIKAKLKRLDGGETEIKLDISEINENGERTFEYSGKPYFEEPDIEGIEVYKAYNLTITCVDSTEKEYTMVKRINTMGTAFHLKNGGEAASFGKYSERNTCVDSAWDIHSDENIEAEGDISGGYFRIKNGIYFADEEGTECFHGIGNGNNNFSRGNHTHGNISSDGKIVINGKIITNAVLLVDENGEITAIEKLPTSRLEMEEITKSSEIMKASGVASVGGTDTTNLCYADHIHPYNDAWKSDNDFQALVNGVNTLIELAEGGW